MLASQKAHLCLGALSLQHVVQLGREHNVAFHFELAGHKGLLTVQLAFTKVREGVITDVDDTVSLALGLALVNGNILLQVNSLDELLASSILNVEFKDGICLLMR